MKKILLLIALIICIQNLNAQKILYRGIIHYERKVNMHKQILANVKNAEWAENMLKKMPKYKVTNFDLSFNQQKSLFKKSKEQPDEEPMRGIMGMGGSDDANEVFKNIDSNQIIAQKQLFEKTIILQDSIAAYAWKMTNDFKTIAGYNCRRAETIIYDSLYVIAFFTDAVYPSTGPESFGGLPGTILGIVIPRLNTTYFATKVENIQVSDDDIIAPKKGEKNTYEDVTKKVKKASADWGGNFTGILLWNSLL